MAVAVNQASLADRRSPGTTFTMSLTKGWDRIPPEQGGRLPMPGDVIVLEIRKPQANVVGPPGWTWLGEIPWNDDDGERMSNCWWRMITAGEPDPVFWCAESVPEWEVRGMALTGYAPIGDGLTGSSVLPSLPL